MNLKTTIAIAPFILFLTNTSCTKPNPKGEISPTESTNTNGTEVANGQKEGAESVSQTRSDTSNVQAGDPSPIQSESSASPGQTGGSSGNSSLNQPAGGQLDSQNPSAQTGRLVTSPQPGRLKTGQTSQVQQSSGIIGATNGGSANGQTGSGSAVVNTGKGSAGGTAGGFVQGSDFKKDNAKIDGRFKRVSDGVEARLQISGLQPNAQHALHIHNVGRCDGPDFTSAGDHFNPEAKNHGAPGSNAHLGDLGNITTDKNGVFSGSVKIANATSDGQKGILQKSIIVHQKADDLKSQPSGDSGDRIACMVIGNFE